MKCPFSRPSVLAGIALSGLAMGGPTFADGGGWEDDDHSYDRARRAVEDGEILCIAELLEQLKTEVPGEVVGIELEREEGVWVYEFKIVDEDGHRLEAYVDASTGVVLSTEND